MDLCIREGTDEPRVAWEAALQAFTLDRFDVMLTYLEKFEAESGTQPWIDYYRAIGLLEQGDAAAAKQAVERERELAGKDEFHLDAVTGCILVELGENTPRQIVV